MVVLSCVQAVFVCMCVCNYSKFDIYMKIYVCVCACVCLSLVWSGCHVSNHLSNHRNHNYIIFMFSESNRGYWHRAQQQQQYTDRCQPQCCGKRIYAYTSTTLAPPPQLTNRFLSFYTSAHTHTHLHTHAYTHGTRTRAHTHT